MEVITGAEREPSSVRAGFEAFFGQWFTPVARAAALIAGDAAAGQDLAQEAFLRAHDRWDRLTSSEHARNFTYAVASNLARSHRRRHLRLVPSGLRHADGVQAPRAAGERWWEIADALAALPARQRACVVLVDHAGMDSATVAQVLSISANTVRVHVMRGRAALRAQLGLDPVEEPHEA